jgi:hypothetical protein
MGTPDTIKRLVDSFKRNINTFKAGSINETQLRIEYLDPFFTSLAGMLKINGVTLTHIKMSS